MKVIALTVRFLVELCAFAALAAGGWHVGGPLWRQTAGAIGFVCVAAAIWGRWVAPRAPHKLPDPQRLVPEWVVFGGAALALIAIGHPVMAGLLAGVAAADRIALHGLEADEG